MAIYRVINHCRNCGKITNRLVITVCKEGYTVEGGVIKDNVRFIPDNVPKKAE
jgi:DNA-binding winged helix-turn-helix (wHTH) protein